MKITTLDSKEVEWKPKGNSDFRADNKSKLHNAVREVIKQEFPTVQVLEEVTVPIWFKQVQYLDFYIPLYHIAIEAHGAQHYSYSTLYHNNMLSFYRQQQNDHNKRRWCKMNNIRYIELPWNEKPKQWAEKLNGTTNG
jgi:hypothetical protein